MRPISLVVIPSLRHPKLVIPREPTAAASAALRNYQASATGLRLAAVRGMALGARLGLLHLLPWRVVVCSSDESIDTHLSGILRMAVNVAMYIGPQRAIQKPVLQIIDSAGHTVAFAKLAINDLTSSLLRCEAESISRLTQRRLRHLGTPQVISYSRWRGSDLIVQTAVPPGGSETRLRRLLPDATKELGRSFGVANVGWLQSDYRARLYTRAAAHDTSPSAAEITRALLWLDDELGNDDLAVGSWHGDWAPWNMTSTPGRVIAWDWEHFETGVPVGLDAIHFDISEQLITGASVVDAFETSLRRSSQDLTSSVCAEDDRSRLVTLYALEIATGYLERGEDRVGGTPLSRIDDWLPEVLRRCRRALNSRV